MAHSTLTQSLISPPETWERDPKLSWEEEDWGGRQWDRWIGLNTHIQQLLGHQKKVTWFMLHDPEAKIQEFWVKDDAAVCGLLLLLLFHDEFW